MEIFDMRYTAANAFNTQQATTGTAFAVPVVRFPKAPKRVIGTLFFLITGKYVLTSCADGTVKLYDVQKCRFEPECKLK